MTQLEQIISLKPHTIVEFDGTEWSNVSVNIDTHEDSDELFFTFGKNGRRNKWSCDLETIQTVISETETINFMICDEQKVLLFERSVRESSFDHNI